MTSNPGKQLVPQEWSSQDLCLPLGVPPPSSSPFQQGAHFHASPRKEGPRTLGPGPELHSGPSESAFHVLIYSSRDY